MSLCARTSVLDTCLVKDGDLELSVKDFFVGFDLGRCVELTRGL